MPRILIIDDEQEVRVLLTEMFERKGHEAVVASDSKEGIALYNENPADVVVLDLILPGQNGFEAIREFQDKFSDVKIIAISGGGSIGPEWYLEVVKYYGLKYAFTKPVERNKLLAAVDHLCEH